MAKKITKFSQHLRNEYYGRRRHSLVYYFLLVALFVGVIAVLIYLKLPVIPKHPVPGLTDSNAAEPITARASIIDGVAPRVA
jgi:hypothetical protein